MLTQTLPPPTEPIDSASPVVEAAAVDGPLQLVEVPPRAVAQILPAIDPWLVSIVDRLEGRYTLATLHAHLVDGTTALWLAGQMLASGKVVNHGVMGTDIARTPSGSLTARVLWMTGTDRRKWMHLLRDYEDVMRQRGCARVEITARKGWARELPDYRMSHVLLEKELV